jgi:hypothetical protein
MPCFCQEIAILREISLEDILIKLNFVMSLVGLTSIEEIYRVLESEIKDVLLLQRHEVILTSCYSTNHIDIGDSLARGEGMHLNFHVSFDIPSEDIILQGFCLSEDELDDVWLACRKYLSYLAMIKVERNPLKISVNVPNSRFIHNVEEVQVQFFLYYEVLRDRSPIGRVLKGRQELEIVIKELLLL